MLCACLSRAYWRDPLLRKRSGKKPHHHETPLRQCRNLTAKIDIIVIFPLANTLIPATCEQQCRICSSKARKLKMFKQETEFRDHKGKCMPFAMATLAGRTPEILE